MNNLKELIELSFTKLERQLRQNMIERLVKELSSQPEYSVSLSSIKPEDVRKLSIVHQSMRAIETSEERKRQISARFEVLSERITLVSTDEEKQRLMFDFLGLITSDKNRLKKDKKAFKIYMGFDVVSERYSKVILYENILQKLALDVIGRLTTEVLMNLEINSDEIDEAEEIGISRYILNSFQLQSFLLDRIRNTQRWQNKVAAFEALGSIIEAIPESEKLKMLDFDTSRSITQYCLDVGENVWIQIGALRLLPILSRDESLRAFKTRLLENKYDSSDNLFVRKAILKLIGERFVDEDGFEILKQFVEHKDKSEYVRIQLMKTLALFQSQKARQTLKEFVKGSFNEDCPQVRAQAVIEWANLSKIATESSDEELLKNSIDTLTWAIRNGKDLLVQRVALEEAAELCNFRENILNKGQVDKLDKVILDAISEVLSKQDSEVKLKRWAGKAWEQIVVKTLPEYKTLTQTLLPKINELNEGESIKMRRDSPPEDEDRLGRVLAFFSRKSFGLYVEMDSKHVKVIRGDRWKRSLWRFLQEVRNLSPDKRQAFLHTVSRKFTGILRAHPGILAELTKTKVPGERLYIEYEDSWRRFIPLLDDYLSLCRRRLAGREVKVFSSYGITKIRGPKSWFLRMRNYLKISWNYAKIASLRNANPMDREHFDPKVYIELMREEYDITTIFSPYSYHYSGNEYFFHDETIERLFTSDKR